MKAIVLLVFILGSSLSYSKTVVLRDIKDLEQRMAVLEKRVLMLENAKANSKTSLNTANGLKTRDLGNKVKQSEFGRGIASPSSESSEASLNFIDRQKVELIKNIKKIKENRSKSQAIIDDIMENY